MDRARVQESSSVQKMPQQSLMQAQSQAVLPTQQQAQSIRSSQNQQSRLTTQIKRLSRKAIGEDTQAVKDDITQATKFILQQASQIEKRDLSRDDSPIRPPTLQTSHDPIPSSFASF